MGNKSSGRKYAFVYVDYINGEQVFYVRLAPVEYKRFSHGIAVNGNFVGEDAASAFADEIEDYFAAALEVAHDDHLDEIEALKTRVKELEAQIISGFYEDRVPQYSQGAPTHELQEVATAEEVNHLVSVIERFRSGDFWVIAKQVVIDDVASRPQMGNAIVAPDCPGSSGLFETQELAMAYLKARNRPLGWVVMKLSQLLNTKS